MTDTGQGTQSAVHRRAAEAQLQALVAKLAPDHERLVGALRKGLRKLLPTAHEVVYEYADCVVMSFSPNEHGYAGVLALRASADEVRLYLNNGKGLPDPEKVLQGTAKLVRWIPMAGASALGRPAVVDLIDKALARNSIPFASSGIGPVIIRSKAAK